MSRVIVKFRNGDYANLEADGLMVEGDYVTAYKRNTAEKAIKENRGLIYEIVGKFDQKVFAAIYISERAEK